MNDQDDQLVEPGPDPGWQVATIRPLSRMGCKTHRVGEAPGARSYPGTKIRVRLSKSLTLTDARLAEVPVGECQLVEVHPSDVSLVIDPKFIPKQMAHKPIVLLSCMLDMD